MSTADSVPVAAGPTLDEQDLRRPDWRAGHAIVLLDGQAWTFPAPTVRFRRATLGDGTRSLVSQKMFAAAYLACLEELQEAHAADDPARAIFLELELAASLLRRNYDLTDDQVDGLIQFGWDEGEPEVAAMTRAIQNLVRGGNPDPKGPPGSGGDRA